MPRPIPVLVVFANPRGTSTLRLGEEDRAITESVRRSKHRDEVRLTKCHAATVHDLSRALLDEDFRIVHLSGHGTQAGLVLEEDDGTQFVVPQHALAKTFSAYAAPHGGLECVILNACYSLSTGTLASLGVRYTIAMEGPISDRAAVEFSRGFYDAIGAGKEISFAYEEGCRRVELAAPGNQFASKLLHLGESYTAVVPKDVLSDSGRFSGSADDKTFLIGFGVDLSGSMRGSMRNDSGGAVTRLEGFSRSLQRTIDTIRVELDSYHGEVTPSVAVFACGFGLRHRAIPYADLFSLLKIGRELVGPDELRSLQEKHEAEVRRNYETKMTQYGGLASLARQYLGSYVDRMERGIRKQAEDEVRGRVLQEVANLLAAKLESCGDTTLSIDELVDLWKESEQTFTQADELIFGSTPMCGALAEIGRRFDRELKNRESGTQAMLFLLSDGEPTDGSPEEALAVLEAIRKLKVTIISCFVADHDVAVPRTLYGTAQQGWPTGARLMFDGASEFPEQSNFAHFLLRKGWSVHPKARLFVQLNHTEVLNEFMDVLTLPAQREKMKWQLPAADVAGGL